MKILKMMLKNSLRHKLRASLTITGIAIAVIAFIVMRTFLTAWNAGLEAAAPDRAIVRHSVSFIFPLPYAYLEKIKKVPGVENVTYLNWFQGMYKQKEYFFGRIAVDHNTFFEVYPEFLVSEEEKQVFKTDPQACIVGEATATLYNIKKGDIMTLEGDIYPGNWDFKVVGIYKPKYRMTDPTGMYFRWDYVNERLEKESPNRANQVGWFTVKVKDPGMIAGAAARIDSYYKNSANATKTESEEEFSRGFLQSTSAIMVAMDFVSWVIVGIIMLVLGNTMVMAARERTREYSVLKTLGFSGKHLTIMILGESMVISVIGGAVGLVLGIMMVGGLEQIIPKAFLPALEIKTITIVLAVTAALLTGVLASIFPIHRAVNTKIVDGFRFVG